MSPTNYHTHSSGTFQSVTFRLDQPVYRALSNACAATGISMNSLVNTAIATYLTTTNLAPMPRPIYRSNYEETIRKLAGGV